MTMTRRWYHILFARFLCTSDWSSVPQRGSDAVLKMIVGRLGVPEDELPVVRYTKRFV
jgi:hypothetical protein